MTPEFFAAVELIYPFEMRRFGCSAKGSINAVLEISSIAALHFHSIDPRYLHAA